MNLHQLFLTKNDCYKKNQYITPTGILVHSTGVNNPNLKRYVGPDDGKLGVNTSNNHWNVSGLKVCVNAFIGKLKDGSIATYQTLPWNMRPWGCASGPKGSYNNSHIQFEICEDGLKDKNYFDKVYKEATELCAYLCKMYNIKTNNIVCHSEAHKLGYASNHGDVMHWFPKFDKSMDTFRSDVQKLLDADKGANNNAPKSKPKKQGSKPKSKDFVVRVIVNELNIRKGPGKNYAKVGSIKDKGSYTITEVNGAWGKLKSEKGWIYLNGYTQRV